MILVPAESHRWVTGDRFAVAFPADPGGLRDGGPRFLTDAFRVAGALAGDNSVTRITGFREVAGGSTGHKAVLSVDYDKAQPGLHTDLFVKFSRDFDNPARDRAKDADGAGGPVRLAVTRTRVSDRGACGAVRRL